MTRRVAWCRCVKSRPARVIVAVGDGTNDTVMIEYVAMGGSSDEVRSHADHVTAAVENDGAAAVMHAIMRRCGLLAAEPAAPMIAKGPDQPGSAGPCLSSAPGACTSSEAAPRENPAHTS